MRTHDGLRLAGMVVTPAPEPKRTALLLHSEGATREQDGFYSRLSAELAERGVASLRFDLPGHGESGQPGGVEPLRPAEHDQRRTGAPARARRRSAGHPARHRADRRVAAGYAARRGWGHRLVLVNPLIDYKEHFVDAQPTWTD